MNTIPVTIGRLLPEALFFLAGSDVLWIVLKVEAKMVFVKSITNDFDQFVKSKVVQFFGPEAKCKPDPKAWDFTPW